MVRREDRISGTEVRGHAARRATGVIDEKSLERLRDLAEEMEGLAHRNFSDHGEEVQLLVACNNDFHSIEASGNSRLQREAERVAEVPLDFEASYWYGPHERMLPNYNRRRILDATERREIIMCEQLWKSSGEVAAEFVVRLSDAIRALEPRPCSRRRFTATVLQPG